jgi:hypothetical protein
MIGKARERNGNNGEEHERWIELFRALGAMLSMQQELVDAALATPAATPAATATATK